MKTFLLIALAFTFFLHSNAQAITTVAGGTGAGSAANQLHSPLAVFVDTAGAIYVADYSNNRIQKFPAGSDSTTNGVTAAGGNGSGSNADQLTKPTTIYVDSNGSLYIADYGNGRVQKFPAGSNSSTAGVTVADATLSHPIGVFLDKSDSLYVSDGTGNSVLKFPAGDTSATAGRVVAGGNNTGTGSDQFNQPNGIYVDAVGNLYVADYFNNRVQKFPAGSNSLTPGVTIAGGNGAGKAPDQLNGPVAVFLDQAGNLYVSDAVNNRIQKFSPGSSSATLGVTIVGDTIAGNGNNQLSFPGGIYVDKRGDIYIADGGNNRIQKWSPATNGVADISTETAISLYPNPNTGSFILQSHNNIGDAYIVYDVVGRLITQGTITSDKQSISMTVPPSPSERAGVRSLSTGSYILQIKGSKALRFTIEN